MDDSHYKPTELTTDRAVELWKRMLRDPKYDNLGERRDQATGDEQFTSAMAETMTRMIPSNVADELLDKFGDELRERLLNPSGNFYEHLTLDVDYGPCRMLRESAEAVGLQVQFPWKTIMHVYNDHVRVSCGYGAEPVLHYPIGNGGWLITTLSGSDITKVIEYVTGGHPEFKTESGA